MKFGKKTFLFFAVFIALIFFCSNVSAVNVSDGQGDVWKQKLTASGYSWNQASSRDNVDITSISYDLSGSQLTATLVVKGEIQSDANHVYYIYLESSSGKYMIYYASGTGGWAGENGYLGEGGSLTNPVSGNTFTATIEINHGDDSFDVHGYAMETVDGTEAYWDYAPNTYAPYYEEESTEDSGDDEGTNSNDSDDTPDGEDTSDETGDGETNTDSENTENTGDSGGESGSGTPGFEILTLIAALAIALILINKRK